MELIIRLIVLVALLFGTSLVLRYLIAADRASTPRPVIVRRRRSRRVRALPALKRAA